MSDSGSFIKTPLFHDINSKIFDKVYEPSEDTFLMIDALECDLTLINELKPILCLEIGCGTGTIITALATSLGRCSCYIATDINETACKVAKDISCYNGVMLDAVKMDLCSGFVLRGSVDLLIFNPPYVVTPSEELSSLATDDEIARSWAGGRKGREVMDCLFPNIPQLLSPNGLFYLLVIAENCPAEIEEVMQNLGFSMSLVKERKIRGEHLMVFRFRRNNKETA